MPLASLVDMPTVPQIDNTYALGFQHFTPGDALNPQAHMVMIRD
jgi:hypothetical protein